MSERVGGTHKCDSASMDDGDDYGCFIVFMSCMVE